MCDGAAKPHTGQALVMMDRSRDLYIIKAKLISIAEDKFKIG
jgi:hypothetical protein